MSCHDKLIKQLCEDAQPVRPIGTPYHRFGKWAIIALVCIGVSLVVAPLPMNFRTLLDHPIHLIEVLLSVFIGLAATLSAFRFSIPGCSSVQCKITTITPLILLFALVLFQLGIGLLEPNSYSNEFWSYPCFIDMGMRVLIPAVILFLLIRSAYTLSVGWAGFLAGIGIMAFGAAFIGMGCTNYSPMHLLLWHYLPILVIGLLGIGLGKWLK